MIFFSKFFEPYASKGARTVPKGYNFVLIDRLYKERVIFLCRLIQGIFGNHLICLLLYLNSESDEDIYMFINSAGGWAYSALCVYDTIKSLVVDVSTFNIGLAASSASFVLAGGTITKRVTFPHAHVVIHQPFSAPFFGPATTMALEVEELFKLRNTFANIYAQNTGKPVSTIQKDLERDTYMTATEAQAYGIVDHIANSEKKI